MITMSEKQPVEDLAKPADLTTGTELEVARAPVMAQTEVQGALIVAQQFPRDEDRAFAQIYKACKRPGFAARAAYEFPRGGKKISGPSVYLAREAAKAWGNIRYGARVTNETEDERTIEAFAWDVQNNVWITSQDVVKKLIQRRGKDGQTRWVPPDERDLRELTNRRVSLLTRNCLLQLLPADLIEDALDHCRKTLHAGAKQSPDEVRKKLITSFSDLGVTPDDLVSYLGHSLEKSSPAELAALRTAYESIRDGAATWSDYVEEPPAKPAKAKADTELIDKLKASVKANEKEEAPVEAEWVDVEPEEEAKPKKGTAVEAEMFIDDYAIADSRDVVADIDADAERKSWTKKQSADLKRARTMALKRLEEAE